jgi:proteasome lid subunit RPN8/RPN11
MIFLDEPILKRLISIAEASDEECCGFIFGSDNNDTRHVTAVVEVKNNSPFNKREHFEISPEDYMQAERFAQLNKMNLLGIFHSHPASAAIPSKTDLKAAQPYFSYFILSLRNKKFKMLRSWVLNDNNQFEEESLSIIHNYYQTHGYRHHTDTAA